MLATACSADHDHYYESLPENQIYITVKKPVDSGYVHTGIYFIAEDDKGIKMHKDRSKAYYTLSPLAFAGVKDVSKAGPKTMHFKSSSYTELCLIFNSRGCRYLEEGTGNLSHQQIAIVIANKLLYVVENITTIRTGVMYVGLAGYSARQIKEILNAVNHKK